MVNKVETTWQLEPHTLAKHIILKKYLHAWIPIIASSNRRIIYIDGFAGPGKYSSGEDGSPLIAIKSLIEHKLIPRMNAEFKFLFIEENGDRCKNLEKEISKLNISNHLIEVKIVCGKFEEKVKEILDFIESEKSQLAPTFLFIDPFGFSGIPLKLIEKFMQNEKCEVLITFMYEDIVRWASLSENETHLASLFGTDKWKEIITNKKLTSKEKSLELHNLYYKQLINEAKIKFVHSFKMINKFNKPDYFLFFGTNHVLGLERMKESMWGVNPRGKFTFSDATYNPKQAVLFSPTPDYSILKKELIDEFKNKNVSIEEIENFVVTKTEFLRKHIRKQVLDKMTESGEIKVNLSKKARKGAYPKGTTVQFL